MKNKSKKEFDFSNLSVSNVPLYALLVLTAVVLAISCLGAFLMPDGQDYIRHYIGDPSCNHYCLSYSGNDHYVMLAMGFIIGIYQFLFLHNKDYARALLVKGEKRKKIFKEKVILPIIALVLISLFIKSIALVENIKVFGVSSLLISNFIAHILIIIVHAIFGFTVGATATILSGTIVEALTGALGIILLPKAILKIADVTASRFLHGYASFYGTCDETATFIDPTRQILERTSDYSIIYKSTATTPTISIIHSVVWLLVSFVILFFLKKFFSKNYKFEKIGFINANKLLTTIICFSASVFIGYYAILFTTEGIAGYFEILIPFIESAVDSWDSFATYNTSILIVAFWIISLLASVIVNLILTRKLKNVKSKLIVPALISMVFISTLIITTTGCFGYSKRMPEINEIKYVDVCTPFAIISNDNEFIGINFYGEDRLNCVRSEITLTEKEDIELLQKLQLSAIENDKRETNDGLKIEYHLKDGSTIRRNYFYLSEETSEEVLKLWETKEVKSNYKLMLLNKGDEKAASYDRFHSNYETYFNNKYFPYIVAKDGTRTDIKSELSPDNFKKLKNAIYKDITSITAEQWFKPETTYGALTFEDNEYPEESLSKPMLVFHNHIFIPVTSEMTNTVEFLKQNNLFKYLENYETNFEAYLYDVNASEYWKDGYRSFGISTMENYNPYQDITTDFFTIALYSLTDIINKKVPLTHSTLFTSEYSVYSSEYGVITKEEDENFKNNIQEAIDLGYATKLSETTAQEYFEKSHFKYYSGTGGNLLLVYYPERGTSQTYILP
ncbi:MAG: hypothetical protein E7522_07390 [Ruminococcaceae bacterium]|nr:hypothetical protein [Oscillospiraceae bacterium]